MALGNLPDGIAISTANLAARALPNQNELHAVVISIINIAKALNDSRAAALLAASGSSEVEITEGSFEQRGMIPLSGKKAKELAGILESKLAIKGALEVAESPRKVGSWIKVTVQEFDDGQRVDLEEHKPTGGYPAFTRIRIQGSSGCHLWGVSIYK